MSDETSHSPEASFDWSAYQARERERARLITAARPANKTALFDALETAGIARIAVHFDGYGDSGQIEGIEVEGAARMLPDASIDFAEPASDASGLERVALPVPEAIEAIVYTLLEQTHEGWENNDGAYGDFVFDVPNRTITLEYNERVTEAEYSEHVF